MSETPKPEQVLWTVKSQTTGGETRWHMWFMYAPPAHLEPEDWLQDFAKAFVAENPDERPVEVHCNTGALESPEFGSHAEVCE